MIHVRGGGFGLHLVGPCDDEDELVEEQGGGSGTGYSEKKSRIAAKKCAVDVPASDGSLCSCTLRVEPETNSVIEKQSIWLGDAP